MIDFYFKIYIVIAKSVLYLLFPLLDVLLNAVNIALTYILQTMLYYL